MHKSVTSSMLSRLPGLILRHEAMSCCIEWSKLPSPPFKSSPLSLRDGSRIGERDPQPFRGELDAWTQTI